VLFLGVDGIDLEHGLSITNIVEASLNQKMIRLAQTVVVLADSSKLIVAALERSVTWTRSITSLPTLK
jgi:DeoR/GlpR family transcriptional regulator of sugar metabolism